MEMKVLIAVDVVPISVALTPNLLHHNNVELPTQKLPILEWN